MQKRHRIEHRLISAKNRKVPLRHPAFLAGGESAHFGSLFEPAAIRSTVLSVRSVWACPERTTGFRRPAKEARGMRGTEKTDWTLSGGSL